MLERIDRYELRERIGAGGQATVYLGHDTLLNRTVAVKVMTQLVSAQPEYVEGLMSEAQLAAGLSVQEMLGHATYATTMDIYSHVDPGMHKEAALEMNKALGG